MLLVSRGAQAAGQVIAPLAPVQAGAQQRPGPPLEPVHLDAEAAELRGAVRRQHVTSVALADQAASDQRLGHRDPTAPARWSFDGMATTIVSSRRW
jgi:hypothetical protein